ncbi:MAG: ATP-binding protein [Nitrospinae bacterium]|nr:ATP-binding protein [Nitrospinota bacterium]
MIKRNLENYCFSEDFGKQMRFIAGPRQSGKTTIIKSFLEKKDRLKDYYNWDYRETRTDFQKNPDFYNAPILEKNAWVCFDEIHKYPKWKDILKEAYDKNVGEINFVITGSARLDLFRKSGDSLAGRYFLFRLNPLSLNELTKVNYPCAISCAANEFIRRRLENNHFRQEEMLHLLEFSGFPDPFLSGKRIFHKKWKNDYIDKVIHEDIREIAQVREIENISRLMLLLPVKVGSPLSVNSLMEDMLCSYNALRNYLYLMELSYVTFFVPPYSHGVSRAIKKDKKLYFYDWTRVQDEHMRFENYVAMELKILADIQNDLGETFSLQYVRKRDGKESDFLLVKDNSPWLLIEVKTSRQKIASHHYTNAKALGDIPILQIVRENVIAENCGNNSWQVSASRFFA